MQKVFIHRQNKADEKRSIATCVAYENGNYLVMIPAIEKVQMPENAYAGRVDCLKK